MEQRVSLITLGVADLARARRFYEALGWRTNAGPEDDVVFFQAGGMVLALWDRARLAEDSGVGDPGGWGGITLAHNVRSPAEVDDVVAGAERSGGTITRAPGETFWGGYSGAFADPGGWGGITLAHNVRSPAEVDDVVAGAQRAGGTVTRAPGETFWGGYSGAFADPDGHPWEVAHNPRWEIAPDGSVTLPP